MRFELSPVKASTRTTALHPHFVSIDLLPLFSAPSGNIFGTLGCRQPSWSVHAELHSQLSVHNGLGTRSTVPALPSPASCPTQGDTHALNHNHTRPHDHLHPPTHPPSDTACPHFDRPRGSNRPPGYALLPEPVKAASKPKKLPFSPWLCGLLKSTHRLTSMKPVRKSCTTIRASRRRAGGRAVGPGGQSRNSKLLISTMPA